MNQFYITKEDYEKFWDLSLNEDEFKDFKCNLILAKEKIDSVTKNRIVAIGFDNLTNFQKEKIKMAMYYQVSYIEENGTEINDVSAYSVLDISITVDEKTKTKAQKLNMSSFALDQLEKTGLCTNLIWH